MTIEKAIEQCEYAINVWYEFWSGASHAVSEETIEAIETLIKAVKQK